MRFITFFIEAFPPLPKNWLLYLWNFYPPYFFSGIRICRVSHDFTFVETALRLRWWNRNYIGTLFGGSIYAMCDPIHMVMLMELLGPGYIVRDNGAQVRFLKKGTGRVSAQFSIQSKTVAEIWSDPAEVQERQFLVHVRNSENEIVAEVLKSLHIRRKLASTTNTE